jgi:GntR family transcriptional regulator
MAIAGKRCKSISKVHLEGHTLTEAATRPDFSRSAISRYVQLAALFRRRIEPGEWAVGSQIPTVDDLAEECGVARATIRQAIDLLSEERLVERFRAKGTFVTRSPQEEMWCAIPTDWSGLLRPSTDDSRIEVISGPDLNVKLPITHRLGTAAGHYDHVRRRHWRGDRPFLIADLYIADSLRKLVSKRDLLKKTALKIASDVLGTEIGDAQHTITIGAADIVTAELLSIPVNAPVAYIRREVVAKDGVLVLVSDGIYRGDVVRIDVKLR